jgi:uncharacterized protein (DUF433 family)
MVGGGRCGYTNSLDFPARHKPTASSNSECHSPVCVVPKGGVHSLLLLEYNMTNLDRITQKPDVMGGKACVRGLRVTVAMIVNQLGAGHSVDQVLADYPYLEREDVLQALRYAAWLSEDRELVLAVA